MPKQGSGMPAGYNDVIQGINTWNDRFGESYQGAQDWAKNNPWAQGFSNFYNNTLSGSMANNPWMSRLYGQTEGLDMNESLDYLREFLGGPPRGSAGAGAAGAKGPTGMGRGQQGQSSRGLTYSNSSTASGSSYGGRASRGGGRGRVRGGAGTIPDSTVGDKFFSREVNKLFDPARLDPANDPTIQPMIDALQRESEETYWRSVRDLTDQMEGAGRFGGSLYQAMRGQAGEEYNEALQGTMAQQYQAAREAALARQMEALGLVNTRDISQAQINAQLEAAAMQAREAAASRSAASAAQRDANRLNAINMMMNAGQFGMTMGGNMAQLMSQNQLGAGQLGLGFGQLGLQGYDTSANFGQLGMGAMQNLGNIYGDAAANRLNQQRLAEEQRRYNDQAPVRDITNLIDIMRGLNDLGGYNYQQPFVPGSAGPAPEGFNWGDLLGAGINGLGALLGTTR